MKLMTTIVLIRHGMTQANKEKRYIGVTDEPLLEESVHALVREREKYAEILQRNTLKNCYVSPLLRCRQTADALFPDVGQIIIEDFRECNFGLFENKNYEELNGNPAYQRFIDSNGQTAFPEGEDQAGFCVRVNRAFEALVKDYFYAQINRRKALTNGKAQDVFLVVAHGGTIMAILSQYADEKKTFYDWQLSNNASYKGTLFFDDETGKIEITNVKKNE